MSAPAVVGVVVGGDKSGVVYAYRYRGKVRFVFVPWVKA